MAFINWIVQRLNDASDLFYSIYLEIYYWLSPFDAIAPVFYEVCLIFNRLAWSFYDFGLWVNDTTQKLTTFFNELDLEAWFKDWKGKILDAWNWWRDKWSWFRQEAGEWWDDKKQDVQDWIAIATEGLDSLKVAWGNFWNITFPEWTGKLDNLKGEWDNFWTATLPNLVSFQGLTTWWNERLKDIDDLTTTRLTTWFPFYDSLAELWNSIEEFFTDPEDWLYKAADRIIERFW